MEEPTDCASSVVIVKLHFCSDICDIIKAIKSKHFVESHNPKCFSKFDVCNKLLVDSSHRESSCLLTFYTPFGRY